MKFKSGDRLFLYLIIATILQLSSAIEHLACNNHGEVRLVGGRSTFEGRVEVCHHRVWKTVCDRMWREEEAKVVCRQLNYSDPSNGTFVRRGCAGQGSEDQDILRVIWHCSGEELNLLDCNKTETTPSKCDHRRDVGVYCSGQTPDDCEEHDLRLVDGPNNASGRVEVCRFGCWGTVCDEEWDRDDAIVACRQLGFETELAIPIRRGYFGSVNSSRPIHVSRTKCGRESDVLTNCSEFTLNDHNCTHNQDAGVICYGTSTCQDGDVQLVEGDSERVGIVEMCYNGVWGTVCANGWNEIAATIVCNQTRYTNSTCRFPLGWGNFPTLFNNITCSETDSMLLQCIDVDSIGVYDCGENNAARVRCEMPNPDVTTSSVLTKTSQAITGLMIFESPTTNSQSEVFTSAVPNSIWPTNADMITLSAASNTQSVVLGAVGGLLAVGAITAIIVASVIIMVVVIQKQKRKTFEKDSAVDNPTYDKCQGTSTLNNLTISNDSKYEKEFENPIYSDEIDIGHNSASEKTNTQLQNTPHYEGIYFGSTEITEAVYENADNGVIQGAHVNINRTIDNSSSANDGAIMKGATSEGVYELPPNLDGAAAGDENCYSALDSTYSQLEPHLGVPKPGVEIPYPPNDNDYSHLKYK